MVAPAKPIITTNNGVDYSTNISKLTLTGTVDITTVKVLINGSDAGVIFDAEKASAILISTQQGPYSIGTTNNTFKIAVDGGSSQSVILPTATLTTAQVATEINNQTTGLTASDSNGYLKIVSDTKGATSALLVGDATSTANATLGFTDNQSASGTDAVPWSYPDRILVRGANKFRVVAQNVALENSLAAEISITLLLDTEIALKISAPTSLKTRSYRDSVEVIWIQNPEAGIRGYNVYQSSDPGGGLEGYKKANVELITVSSFSEERKTQISKQEVQVGSKRTTTIVEEVKTELFFSYRTAVDVEGNLLSAGQRQYFVITAIGFDTVHQVEVESIYSEELVVKPLIIDTGIRDLQRRTMFDVVFSYIENVMRVNDEIDVKPGTVTRDVFIDPPADEFRRLYTVLDFINRAQSIPTLLAVDDPDGDGISDLVEDSPYKIELRDALNLETDAEAQQLINDAFDKLGGNVNIVRKPAETARGEVIVYTLIKPVEDIVIDRGAIFSTVADPDLGLPVIEFESLTEKVLLVALADNFYNKARRRYEIRVPVRAIVAGVEGNVGAKLITQIVSGTTGARLNVENLEPTKFGSDEETNRSLAERVELAYVSVDSGTRGGYLALAIAQSGVIRARLVDSGHTLMMRDYDSLRKKHLAGKVDIYVQGEESTFPIDRFSFTFPTLVGADVKVLSPLLLQFQVLDPRASALSPVFSVTRVRNVSRGFDYDLTNLSIVGGVVIDLDETLASNIAIGLDPLDVVIADFQIRVTERHKFVEQPVTSIVSVVGEISGDLSNNYNFIKSEDPLILGASNRASDAIDIFFSGGLPLNQLQQVTNEEATLTGEDVVKLKNVGIIDSTIIVMNERGDVTYRPNIDYKVVAGDNVTPSGIGRITGGTISDGEKVIVSYQSAENILVTYEANALLGRIATEVEAKRHTTADAVVKGTYEVKVDISAVVRLLPEARSDDVDRRLRTNIANLMSAKKLGDDLYQSDIIGAIENTVGVNSVRVPLEKMVRANGSQVVRESLGKVEFDKILKDIVQSYKSKSPVLAFKTVDGGGRKVRIGTAGGYVYRHVAIFEDNVELETVDTEAEVARKSGRSFIRSDGKIVVSTILGDDPGLHTYSASYFVYGETGAKNIIANDFEFISLGELTVEFEAVSA